MDHETNTQHDEINLVRLVRRLEKSTAKTDDWMAGTGLPTEEVWLRAKRTLQNVKYARTLIKNIEANDYDTTPKRLNQLNDVKSRLDRLEEFLKDVEESSKPKSNRPAPILPTIPTPVAPSEPGPQSPRTPRPRSHPPYSESPSVNAKLPELSMHGLSIDPPSVDPDEISPTLITSTLPSLLPSNPAETTASSSAYARSFSSSATARKLAGGGTQTSVALQEELSSQLELMAQQLKRNALHFSGSLEKDRAVVEDAGLKLEQNHDVMMKERLRLRDHRGKSIGTTCMTLGLVLLVIVVFMLMVSVIRFSGR